MDIEINEQGSDAFYREVVNVFYQYRKLSKNPGVKVKNLLSNYSLFIVLDVVLFAVLVYMGLDIGFDFVIIATMVLIVITALITGYTLYSMNVLVKRMRAENETSILTINEDGISLARRGVTVMGLTWEKLSAVRFLKESVCFISGDMSGMMICVQARYEDQIRRALDIYNVD